MKTLLEAEFNELIEARAERDRLRLCMGFDAIGTEAALQAAADALVEVVDRAGYVLTVEQWALPPLAMGRQRTIASIRPARALA